MKVGEIGKQRGEKTPPGSVIIKQPAKKKYCAYKKQGRKKWGESFF